MPMSPINILRQQRREQFVQQLEESNKLQPPTPSLVSVVIDRNGPFFVFPTSGTITNIHVCPSVDCTLEIKAEYVYQNSRVQSSDVKISLKQGIAVNLGFDISGQRGTVCSATITDGFCICTFRFYEEPTSGPYIMENDINESASALRTSIATGSVSDATTNNELAIPNESTWIEGDSVGADQILDGLTQLFGELDNTNSTEITG